MSNYPHKLYLNAEEQIRLLLDQWNAQIPAHSAYAITFFLAILASPLVYPALTNKHFLGIFPFAIYFLVLVGLLTYSVARLAYYVELSQLASMMLGTQGEIYVEFYARMTESVTRAENPSFGMAYAIQGELLYKLFRSTKNEVPRYNWIKRTLLKIATRHLRQPSSKSGGEITDWAEKKRGLPVSEISKSTAST